MRRCASVIRNEIVLEVWSKTYRVQPGQRQRAFRWSLIVLRRWRHGPVLAAALLPVSSRTLFRCLKIVLVVFSDTLLYAFAPIAQDVAPNISSSMPRTTQHRRRGPW